MKKKIIAGILLVLLLAGGYTGWKLFGPAVSTSAGEFLYIKSGSDYDDVKKELISKNFIKSSDWFDIASKLLRYKKIKPGRYKITKGMSVFKLVKTLRAGNQSQINFTIIKIRTRQEFARKAGSAFDFDSLQMINFLNNKDSLKRFGLDTNTVIASMLPFTYTLNWNSTPGTVFQKLFNTYKNFWTGERKIKADSLHLSPIEVTTMASIVEEETLKKSDKLLISSVYLNRVRKGMPLQADPTIRFAMKDFTLKRILGSYLKIASPYNTYTNNGIPPGPICTPSVETIDAVLNAPKTDYLYFVASSKFDGSSIFTSNLTDHMKYAREYQHELTRRMDSVKKANPK